MDKSTKNVDRYPGRFTTRFDYVYGDLNILINTTSRIFRPIRIAGIRVPWQKKSPICWQRKRQHSRHGATRRWC